MHNNLTKTSSIPILGRSPDITIISISSFLAGKYQASNFFPVLSIHPKNHFCQLLQLDEARSYAELTLNQFYSESLHPF